MTKEKKKEVSVSLSRQLKEIGEAYDLLLNVINSFPASSDFFTQAEWRTIHKAGCYISGDRYDPEFWE
jgi:hypothetical protein